MEITPTVGARLFGTRPRGTSGQADCSLLAMRARAPRRCLLWWALEKALHINIQKKTYCWWFQLWGWWSYSSIIVFEGETTNLSSLIQPPTGNYCLRDMKHASWINCTIFNHQPSVNQPLVDHRHIHHSLTITIMTIRMNPRLKIHNPWIQPDSSVHHLWKSPTLYKVNAF